MKKIKYKYRKFTIIEYVDDFGNSTFKVCWGLLKTPPLTSEAECRALIDTCYSRADEKRKNRRKK